MNLAGDLTAAVLMVVGALVILISAIGVVRFEGPIARCHALGLGATLGLFLMLLGVAIGMGSLEVAAKLGLTLFFMFLTAPVGSHMIGRAVYRLKSVPLRITKDEWGEHDHPEPDPPDTDN